MSRIGKKTIIIPDKTKVTYSDRVIKVQGAKGTLEREIHPSVDVKIDDAEMTVVPLDDSRQTNAFRGMTRALISNMVTGVNTGFNKVLEINGIGYKAEVKGKMVVLSLGFSHPVEFNLPEGIDAQVEKNLLTISGIDKAVVGETAAKIRMLRPPEPYKGKGIKYQDETIQRKAGKTGTK